MKTTWFWVTGSIEKGLKISTKRPRTKFVREPLATRELAQRYIAGMFLGINF